MTDKESLNSLTQAQWVDQACDRFEMAWRTGQPVTIESIIGSSPEPFREVLLNELVAIEIELRRSKGEYLLAEEFIRRFPGIDSNIAGLAEAVTSTAPSSSNEPTIDSPCLVRSRKHDDFVGTTIQYLGDYELMEQIARGGMGIVYKARQQSLGRIVAVKMILGGQFAEKQDVDRFHSEATAAAKLDHPGIVPIYEVGEQDGYHFYSMGFVEGGSLAQRLQEGPLPPRDSAELLSKIADAVHYAHLKGVIHRDIKPANILMDANGQPRVTDFGLAKIVKGSSDLTRSGQILGTPSYMPPEQAAAQASAIGPASDVYSLGALLYSLLTGRPPFQAASPIETLLQVQKQEPVSPRQFNANVPIDLETITLKCLDKSPARRYTTAEELATELRRYLSGEPILARPISRAEQAWRWCCRNPAVASLATLILLLISGIAFGSAWAYLRESGLRKDLKVAFDNQRELTASERRAKLEEAEARKAADAAKLVADRATLDARKAAEVARKAAEEAEAARIDKERQANIAEQEKDKAKASEDLARRNLYVADMARIAELIREPNLSRAKSLLKRHLPKLPGEDDLRGFDWHYCWRQVSQEEWARQFKESVEVMDLSEDEQTLAVGCKGGRAYLMDVDSGKIQDFVFSIDDEHWSSLALIQDGRLVGNGRQGEFKIWNRVSGETIATKESGFAHYRQLGTPWEGRVTTGFCPAGTFMVGADFAHKLALWNLKTLRRMVRSSW